MFENKFNQSANQQQNQNPLNQENKGLFSLPPAVMNFIPWIPFALEAMTGQKIPQIGGTIGEIQASLQQIQFSLSQLLNSQQQITARLESLENNV